MFNRTVFSAMRRAGMGVGVSKAKLTEAMIEVLLDLPPGSTNLKETIVAELGMIGQMAATRDINDAWNQAKMKASRKYPDKFILDGRNSLIWNDGKTKAIDKNVSPANFKKLNELASEEGCTVNTLITRLLKVYKRHQ